MQTSRLAGGYHHAMDKQVGGSRFNKQRIEQAGSDKWYGMLGTLTLFFFFNIAANQI